MKGMAAYMLRKRVDRMIAVELWRPIIAQIDEEVIAMPQNDPSGWTSGYMHHPGGASGKTREVANVVSMR